MASEKNADQKPSREQLAAYGYALPKSVFEETHPADSVEAPGDDRPAIHDERAFASVEAQFGGKAKAAATGEAAKLPHGAGGKVPASTVAVAEFIEGNILESGARNAVPDAAAAGEGGPVATTSSAAGKPASAPVKGSVRK